MIKISSRLKDIINHLEFTENIIDIGCDHAKLAIYLIQNNYYKEIYVSDNKKNAINNAKINIKDNLLENSIISLCGDGLEVISNPDINTIIISGLGTDTILSILNNKKIDQVNKIIVQSNNHHYKLRSEIENIGYQIIKETVVLDNSKYYVTISFVKGNNKLSNIQLKYGIHNNIKYLEHLLENTKNLRKKLKRSTEEYEKSLEEESVLTSIIADLPRDLTL